MRKVFTVRPALAVICDWCADELTAGDLPDLARALTAAGVKPHSLIWNESEEGCNFISIDTSEDSWVVLARYQSNICGRTFSDRELIRGHADGRIELYPDAEIKDYDEYHMYWSTEGAGLLLAAIYEAAEFLNCFGGGGIQACATTTRCWSSADSARRRRLSPTQREQ